MINAIGQGAYINELSLEGNNKRQAVSCGNRKSNNLENTPDSDSYISRKKSQKGGKFVLGLLIAAGMAVAADFIFAKGKHLNNIFNKEVKKAGISEKSSPRKNSLIGKAIKSDKSYTGEIEQVKNDGTKIVRKYKDGKIIETDKNGILSKKYIYDSKDGKLSEVREFDFADKTAKQYIMPDESGKYARYINLKFDENTLFVMPPSITNQGEIIRGEIFRGNVDGKSVNKYAQVTRTIFGGDKTETKYYLNGHEMTLVDIHKVQGINENLEKIPLKFD